MQRTGLKEIGIKPTDRAGRIKRELVARSFLNVRSSGYNIDLYTMYLHSRRAGTLATNDPVTARTLTVWREVLTETTPSAQARLGIEEVKRIAENCAKNWPPALTKAFATMQSEQVIRNDPNSDPILTKSGVAVEKLNPRKMPANTLHQDAEQTTFSVF